ncbi:MAG: NUDIX hydrolase [Candidatus Cloacimonetes bacterium]|nr:NUDIX hydrolase [Candidatus Cloacimonadota bacterium]
MSYKNPYPTVDIIITNQNQDQIILIKRKNPPLGWALPGGFVDWGESLEQAALREAKEETDLNCTLICQFHTYSDPDRDPRHHTISTVFIAKASGIPKGLDDATEAKWVNLSDLPPLVFDHKKIIADYLENFVQGSSSHFL